jgi:hypothetical protein
MASKGTNSTIVISCVQANLLGRWARIGTLCGVVRLFSVGERKRLSQDLIKGGWHRIFSFDLLDSILTLCEQEQTLNKANSCIDALREVPRTI